MVGTKLSNFLQYVCVVVCSFVPVRVSAHIYMVVCLKTESLEKCIRLDQALASLTPTSWRYKSSRANPNSPAMVIEEQES